MLILNNIEVRYQNVILVLRGVTLEVPSQGIVCLLGANGSGKSTTLKSISGLLNIEEGKVTDGAIEFEGLRIDGWRTADIVSFGIVQVLEGRRTLEPLTVEENLIAGTVGLGTSRAAMKKGLDKVYHYFPVLRDFHRRTAGYLSGGEQQMLVVGRALMTHPKLMLMDEPSLGLAPLLVKETYEIIQRLNKDENISILIVEQNARLALEVSNYGYVLENGRVVLEGTSDKLRGNEDIKSFYLGLTELGEKKGFRNIKHYKRRKRWLG